MVSKKIVALLMALSLIIGAGGSYLGVTYFTKKQEAQTLENMSDISNVPASDVLKMESVFSFITSKYYKKVNKTTLTNGAIKGMVESLNDPFSSYMDPETANQFTQSLSSSFEGIGAEVQMDNGVVTVVSPIKGSPADKAGLKPRDQLLEINGKSTQGMSLDQAVSKIKGKSGTKVTLEVKRPGQSHVLTFEITRGKVPLKTVSQKTFQQDGKLIGYIAIQSFSENTDKEFADALKTLESKNIKGLIIDVRGDPGGYLTAVKNIANDLIASSKPIVQIQNRAGQKQLITSKLKQKKPYPIVGMIDGGSASAAEILSAALHEAGGYPLVGVKSFGKGTVQQAVSMTDGSELKLTMFKWLTPDGNWIHKKGIQPTIKIQEPDYFFTTPINLKDDQTLKPNTTNDQIADAQKMLKGVGFDPGRVDGYYDASTETAVSAFQKTNQLPVTGVIDAKTASSLEDSVMKAVNDPKNDLQLQEALKVVTGE
ncbi:S41 family peptidase [Pullulanibacillus sp. KACC 23026]|uniref:S41 family peptidase n=1 Tax=Pullulanibacillus sp. KACC 23026 TaxID=3028315 RepID=UPI0023AE7301|nr:S41 family peptidase [Pullulanibacillus sp. KACC 23026]WEG13604.1 S41 family peptidase [Pullulanibacillus sp. KACC 23026]